VLIEVIIGGLLVPSIHSTISSPLTQISLTFSFSYLAEISV